MAETPFYKSPKDLHIHKEFPYTKAMTADVRGMGFPAYLCPHPIQCSASRLGMLSKHITQAIPVKGSEFIRTFTGFEQDHGTYTFDSSAREMDGQVLALIAKYDLRYDLGKKSNDTPFYTVIYRREDGVIDLFTLERYQMLTDGWGYPNVWSGSAYDLNPNSYISKDTVLSHTPNKKDGLYGIGVNANVAYLSMPFTKEDGVGVSESMAKKLCSWGMKEITANIRYDYIPINLYGTKDEPKFFPNIGERIRSDGIICAFRPVTPEKFPGDASPKSLSQVDPSSDIIFIGPENGIVTDVDFLVNRQKRQQAYPQVRMYQNALAKYYETILEVHAKWSKTHKFSAQLEDLVSDAIKMLSALGFDVPGIKLPSSAPVKDQKHQVVDYIQAKFTCFTEVPFGKGSKLSDLQGGKATCAEIIPDEDMPVDDYGNRADIIMEPNSPVKRTNYGGLMEPMENFILGRVFTFVKEAYLAGDIDTAFELIVDITNDFHPSYSELIVEMFSGNLKREFVEDIIEYGHIPLNVLPGMLNTTADVKRIKDKWKIEETPVTFNWTNSRGEKRSVRSKKPCMIGSKYIIRLCKEAIGMSAGISSVSHYGTPTRSHQSKKYGSMVRLTPVRFGEDETNIQTMAVSVDEVLRLQRLTSKSLGGALVMIEELLTAPKPTRIGRFNISNAELCRSDTIVGQFNHLNYVCGIDTYNTALTIGEYRMMKDLPEPEIESRVKRRRRLKAQ